MKSFEKTKYLQLIAAVLTVLIVFMACDNEEKDRNKENDRSPALTQGIKFQGIKSRYVPGEELVLLLDSLSGTVDSIAYFLGDNKLAVVKANTAVKHTLTNERFGKQVVRAILYNDTDREEQSLAFDFLPALKPALWRYRIVKKYPHDKSAYTQGLEFYRGNLMESTGNGMGRSGKQGKSSIRLVNPNTGLPIIKVELPDAIFGEGATVLQDKIYQLTYTNNLAYVYDAQSLKKIDSLPYFQAMEGWGLTNDGKTLYMSDGSETIYQVDPKDFTKKGYINVATNERTIPKANEMEWVDGKIYTNFFEEDVIAVIDPKTGTVEALIDLSALSEQVGQHIDLDVLNGIAYNKESGTFFVTGKNWDTMFEIAILKD